jgi:hypothetical protein
LWNHPFALGSTWFLRTGAQNLVAPVIKGIQIHNQVALGRLGLGKSNQGGQGKRGCLGETRFSAKRTVWVAPSRVGLGAEKETKPQPSSLLDQGKGLYFFHHLPCLWKTKKNLRKGSITFRLNRKF